MTVTPVEPGSLAGEYQRMTFNEAITGMLQRPGYLAVLDTGKVLKLNRAAYVLDATKPGNRYALLNAGDVMAVTWQLYTPEQLTQAAAASNA